MRKRPPARCVAICLLATLSAVAAPPGGTEWLPLPAMSDEFDGKELDAGKWHDHNPAWKGRPPVFFHPDCVELKGGLLRLHALASEQSAERGLPEGFTHVSGYVRSKAPARFGYFEMRAKLMDGPLVSCFWLSEHAKEEWSEIDCVEIAAGVKEHASTFRPNTHYFFGPHYQGTHDKHLAQPAEIKLPFRCADGFHIYGVEWNASHIRWYVDGKMVRELENSRFYQPLRMSINLESNRWFDALPDDRRLPGVYEIDWVRAWRPAGDP